MHTIPYHHIDLHGHLYHVFAPQMSTGADIQTVVHVRDINRQGALIAEIPLPNMGQIYESDIDVLRLGLLSTTQSPVLYAAVKHRLCCVDTRTGRVLHQWETPNHQAVQSLTVLSSGAIYVLAGSTVYAFA